MKNIILTGFMGTGKTTTGKILANELGLTFMDMDAEIEKLEGCPIPEIFQRKGEAYFRAVESSLAKRLAERKNLVISTGGGIVKDPANIKNFRQTGLIVLLTAPLAVIFARTQEKGERPVLDREAGDRREAVARLWAERAPLYADCDFSVDTGEKTPFQAAKEIVSFVRSR